MKTSTAVLLTAAVFGAGQGAFWIWHSSQDQPANARLDLPTAPQASPQTGSPSQPRTIISTAPPASAPSNNLVVRAAAGSSTSIYPASPGETNATVADDATPLDQETPMSREELARRAQAVQEQTQQRLETLTRDLNLTEDQQDYLFGVIAKASPAYVPALNVGYVSGGGASAGGGEFTPIISSSNASNNRASASSGSTAAVSSPTQTTPANSTTTSLNDQIYEVLAEDQQEILEEELMDRDRWWSDIIGELEEEHDELINGTGVVTTPDPDDSDPDQEITTGEDGEVTEEVHHGGNLFGN